MPLFYGNFLNLFWGSTTFLCNHLFLRTVDKVGMIYWPAAKGQYVLLDCTEKQQSLWSVLIYLEVNGPKLSVLFWLATQM